MEIISTIKQMQAHSEQTWHLGQIIAFVPTMGFLHEGHLSLIREARKRADEVVVSIFVNPTQFGPGEDLEAYPRDLPRDIELIRQEGADIIFTPKPEELYPKKFQTFVELEKLPAHLCGISRPMHFKGVATVVAKLFNIVKPHVAVFGQKDFQQLAVIRQMVQDLNFDVEIIGAPTVRESDGLAMSSRNTYLTNEQRESGLSLYQSLQKVQALLEDGINNADELIKTASELIQSRPETQIDYVSICDPDTLEDLQIIDRPALMALAVKVGKTRLIDNIVLNP